MSAVAPQIDSVRKGYGLAVLCHGETSMVNNLKMTSAHSDTY
jgi:hypothetical protein